MIHVPSATLLRLSSLLQIIPMSWERLPRGWGTSWFGGPSLHLRTCNDNSGRVGKGPPACSLHEGWAPHTVYNVPNLSPGWETNLMWPGLPGTAAGQAEEGDGSDTMHVGHSSRCHWKGRIGALYSVGMTSPGWSGRRHSIRPAGSSVRRTQVWIAVIAMEAMIAAATAIRMPRSRHLSPPPTDIHGPHP